MPTTGQPIFIARSITLTIFSPKTSPSDPPKTVKSCANTQTCLPSTVPYPVTTPSPYGRVLSIPNATDRCRASSSISTNEPSSSSASIRSGRSSCPWRAASRPHGRTRRAPPRRCGGAGLRVDRRSSAGRRPGDLRAGRVGSALMGPAYGRGPQAAAGEPVRRSPPGNGTPVCQSVDGNMPETTERYAPPVIRGLKIALLGTRGVPAQYGGFETAVEEIGARLVQRGHDVTVYCGSDSDHGGTTGGCGGSRSPRCARRLWRRSAALGCPRCTR
jgi:hypothetical protein